MIWPLLTRLEWARSFRDALSARLGIEIKSEATHDPYDHDAEQSRESLSEESIIPRLTSEESGCYMEIDVRHNAIIVRWPGPHGRGGRKQIDIEEGIGGRMAIELSDDEIIDLIVEKRQDAMRRHANRKLRELREEVEKKTRSIDHLKSFLKKPGGPPAARR